MKDISEEVELHENLRNPFKKGRFFQNIFDNSHLKYGKMKKVKIKK